jgi:hypothetical protein
MIHGHTDGNSFHSYAQTLDDTKEHKPRVKAVVGMQVEETGGSWMSSMDIIDLVLERLVSTKLHLLPAPCCCLHAKNADRGGKSVAGCPAGGCPPTSSSNRAIINPSKCRPHPAKSLNRGHLSWTTESLPKSRRSFPHLFELAPSLPPSQILCAHPSNLSRRMSDATIVCKSAKICRSFRRAAGSDAIWERLVRRRWTCKLK